MSNTETILQDALSRIKPSEQQEKEANQKINSFVNDLQTLLSKHHIKAKPLIGGSFAKGTWLATEFDVDIFVRFDDTTENMSDLLEKILPQSAKRVHGSRDYYQIQDGDIQYEIVPVQKIVTSDQAQNVTDCSPLHVEWVKKQPNLQDDIRLTKQFLKSHRIYGAESYLQGFSGHVTDILTIHYGGFLPLLKAASKWKAKTIIDPEKHYKSHILHYLNKSKTQGPLVVVDPLDKTRNAAAAVGEEAFEILSEAAQDFLKRPRTESFEIHHFSPDTCKADLLIEFELKEGKRDIRGNKLVKSYQCLVRSLEEFGITESSWEWDGKGLAYCWFYLKNTELSSTKEQPGPPLNIEHAVAAFRKSHQNVFERDGHLFATVEREHTTIKSLVTEVLASPYIRERIADCKILRI